MIRHSIFILFPLHSSLVGSHWENELFQGDLMAPTDASDASPPRISRMTLAFFEDSGWYIGNWTISSYLDWGRNEGCDFAQLTSNAYAARYPTQPYFCTAPTQPSDNLCTFNGLSHGFCYQSIFSTLGLVTTVSSSPNSIGLRYVRAYCISPWIYNNTVGNPAFDAALSSNIGWTIGPNARCLQIQGLVEGGLMLNVAINTCINTVCDQSTNALTYSLNNARVVCPNPGSYSSAPITVDLASASGGSISSPAKALCPSDTKSYCRALSCPSSSSSINPCSSAQGGGVCFEGSCVCSFGFTGTNCESRFLPQDLAVLPSLVAPPPSSSISPPPLSQPSAIIGNISPPPLLPRSTSLPPPSPPPPPPPNKNVNSNTQSSSIVTTSTDSKNGLDLFGNGNVAASIVVLVFAGIMVLTVMGLIAFLVVKRMERSKEESKRRNYAETIEVWNNGSTNPTPAYPPPPSWPQNSQYPPRTSSPGSYNYNAWPNPGSPSGAMGGLPPAPSSGLSPHGIPLTVISPYMQPSQPQTPQAQVQGQGQGQGQGGSRPRYVMIPPSGPSPPTRYNY